MKFKIVLNKIAASLIWLKLLGGKRRFASMKSFWWLLLFQIGLLQSLSAQNRQPAIDFASDTQEPMWIEKLWLKSNHNLQATKMIFKDIDSLRPKALFILGDVVSLGKSKHAWKNIDRYIGQTVKDSIPVYATLGNHEVMMNAKKGTANFVKRFSAYRPSGYAEIVDSVAVVLLNSNFPAMSAAEIAQQNEWYKAELHALDKDPAVKMVVVGCHHSPFTNSIIVSPSQGVRNDFVPPFIQSKKTMLFLSGHSHNFERFQVQGKYFLVIGGGGGLHQPLRPNNSTMHDLSADYKPEFHYLEVMRQGEALEILSRRLKTDFSGFTDGYQFTIKK